MLFIVTVMVSAIAAPGHSKRQHSESRVIESMHVVQINGFNQRMGVICLKLLALFCAFLQTC